MLQKRRDDERYGKQRWTRGTDDRRQACAGACGNDRLRCRARPRHRHSHALPFAEPDACGRMPVVRGGYRRARALRRVRAAGRTRHEGLHKFGKGASCAKNAARTADGGPPVALCAAGKLRRLRTGNLGESRGGGHAAIPAPHRFARSRRFLAGNCRGSRRVHSLRPLHPRLRRNQKQFRPWAHGQGLFRRHRVRSEFADGRFHLYFLRRMHGLLPHRRADEQRRGGHGHCRGPRRAESDGGGTSQAAGLRGRFRHVSGTESRRHCEAALPQGRSDLPRRRVWLDGVLHPGRQSASDDCHADCSREDARRRAGLLQAAEQRAGGARAGQARRRSARSHHPD